MSLRLRRFATLILLLTVPLRVYAAAAMVLCGPAAGVADVESLSHAHHHEAAHAHRAGNAHVPAVHESAATDSHWVGPNGVSFHDDVFCAGCCCAAMIATASFDWKPQAFPTPEISLFVVHAVPSTVPHRLERPPRTIFA